MAVDYWLEIDNVESESSDDGMGNAIQLMDFEWSQVNKGSFDMTGGGGGSSVEMSDIMCKMYVNKATPVLFSKCSNSHHLTKAKISARKGGTGQQAFFWVELGNVVVSYFDIDGRDDVEERDMPISTIKLHFDSISMSYKPQDKGGQMGAEVNAGYDISSNAKL